MEGDRGEGGFVGNIGETGAGVRTDLRLQVHLLPAAVGWGGRGLPASCPATAVQVELCPLPADEVALGKGLAPSNIHHLLGAECALPHVEVGHPAAE